MDFKKYLPYDDFRPKQFEIVSKVYTAIQNKRNAIVDAPNGFGKTLAVLISTLPFIHENGIVFYLTRTNREVKRVEDEILLISSKFPIPAISIKNKKDSCVNENLLRLNIYDHGSFNSMCNMLISNNKCIYFKNFFKIKQKFLNIETIYFPMLGSTIRDLGINVSCCPYEIQRVLISKAKVILSTYNYFLSPDILLDFNILNRKYETKILVIDEAHNILDFVSNLFNQDVDIGEISKIVDKLINTELRDFTYFIIKFFEEQSSKNRLKLTFSEFIETFGGKVEFHELLKIMNKEIINLIAKDQKNLSNILYNLYNFIRNLAYLNSSSKILIERKNGSLIVRLLTLDFSNYFETIFKPFTSKIFVSATIKPHDFFIKMLNIKDVDIIEANPFKESKIFSIFEVSTSTRYVERNGETFNKYCEMVCEIIEASKKNTIIFFPSYNVLESILKSDLMNKVKKTLYIEQKNMGEHEEEKIMTEFKEGKNKVLLAVQGGKFSEGEDFYPGIIDVVAVVGLAYDPPSPSLNERIEYYDNLFPLKGWLYGSVLPAVRKAIQSLGRAFRGPSDSGIVIFLDSRFSEEYVMNYLPWWYKEKKVAIAWNFGKLKRIINKHNKLS